MSSAQPKLTLYGYFRSSAAARARTALAVKGLSYRNEYVHLLRGEQRAEPFATQLNPSKAVPVLKIDEADGSSWTLTQSAAILEFLDERFSEQGPRLLPTDGRTRAIVRMAMNMVVCDMQPICNAKVLTKLDQYKIDRNTWASEFMSPSLDALERLATQYSTDKRFLIGSSVTLADVALAPQVYTCQRFGITLDGHPTLAAIFANIASLPAFVEADWRHQPDTPEEFRAAPST